MKISILKFVLIFLALTCPMQVNARPAWQVLKPAISDRNLKNPDAGYCFMAGLQDASEFPPWLLELSSMVYFRLNWADVVDAQGRPDFERLDKKYFDGFRKKGLRLSFRIMAANPHAEIQSVMPRAILDRGIPTVEHRGVNGKMQLDPVFWNPAYLAEHEKMIEALGRYVDGKPWAGPVDLGGMGDWGEMHLSRWTTLELQSAGYSSDLYLRTVFTLMDQMNRHLPRTTKAFCVAPILMPDPEPIFAQIVPRAVRAGWWLRSDGCSTEGGPPPYVWPYIERWGSLVGLICEPSGGINRAYSGKPAPVHDYMEAVLKSRPSIVNLMGMWDLKNLSPADIQTLRSAAPKIGYRFAVEEAVIPGELNFSPGRVTYLSGKIRLANQGGAPYFGSALPVLEIRSQGKLLASHTIMPQPPLSQILPGTAQDIRFLLALPSTTGSLDLSLSLQDLKSGPLELANADQTSKGTLFLGRIAAVSAAKPAGLLFEMKAGTNPPHPVQGIQVSPTADGWMLQGKNEGDWGYARLPEPFKAKLNHAYAMHIKIRAWAVSPAADPIHFKLGVHDASGGWVTNISTGKYDFSKPGTWQVLSVSYQPQVLGVTLQPAMEKGHTGASSLKAEISFWTLEEIPLP